MEGRGVRAEPRQDRAEHGGGPLSIAVSRQPRAHFWPKVALALSHPRSWPRALGRLRNVALVSSLDHRLRGRFTGANGHLPHVHPVEHHLAHAASAFFCSPFEEAACLTVDGSGDFVSTR